MKLRQLALAPMRAALAIPLLFLLPNAFATQGQDHYYIVGLGRGCAGGGPLIRNCETFSPRAGETVVTADVDDVSGQSVRIRICHEWTFDDGSHPTVRCAAACSPTFASDLAFPPWPWNTTYRVIVDLRDGPQGCEVAATAGRLHVSFT